MTTGLVLAVLGLLLIVVAIASGGGPTIYTLGLFAVGALIAVVGFGRRVLAALESR